MDLTLKSEHFSNRISEENNRKISSRFMIDFLLSNLFNEKEYAYTTFLKDITKVSKRYRIRPRNFLIGFYMIF